MITTLVELYAALDELFDGISDVCQYCTDDDCLGYLWLLPEEAVNLYEAGVELLEVNGKITFINPFTNGDEVDVERVKPLCPWYQNRRCSIRFLRPFFCRMYPVNFAAEDDNIYLVLHLDCEYAKQHEHDVKFHQMAIGLFRRLNSQFFSQILNTYRLVETISKFPAGKNRYLRLIDVKHFENILNERR